MGPKSKTIFVCQSCGSNAPRWMGKCPECGQWNSLVEEVVSAQEIKQRGNTGAKEVGVSRLSEIKTPEGTRFKTGIEEFDRVLGGGIVEGSVVLLGGDPGIGKSTLLLQVLAHLNARSIKTLYATGEESPHQIALRAERIGGPETGGIEIIATGELEALQQALAQVQPDVLVVDSVQTIRTLELNSTAGSVGQLREVTSRLIEHAKTKRVAVLLVGHVTKDGMLAGPKVLEHLVDVVLSFEGDRTHAFRLIRSVKNRFGPTHELGVFEMASDGLRQVENASALFLKERPAGVAGSVVVPTADSSRPLLIEVQALVTPPTYSTARRVATGLDAQRLSILLAVLQQRAGMQVLDRDVFASVTGGMHVDERALDLGVALAVASSLRERPVPQDWVVLGEIGLAGEIRAVPRIEPRLMEASKMGFKHAMIPASNAKAIQSQTSRSLELIPVDALSEALTIALRGS